MGPAVAELKKNQFSLGAEYVAGRMDLEFDHGKVTQREYVNHILQVPPGVRSSPLSRYKITDMRLDKVWGKIGYGINDDWEVFLRLGTADMDFDYSRDMRCINGDCTVFPSGQKMDGHNGLAIGFGTKVTFYKKEKLKFGGLFQMSWCKSGGKDTGPLDAASSISGVATSFSHSVNVNLVEMQVAVGPEYRLTDNISIYGGPFMHYVQGRLKGHYYEAGTSVDDGSFVEYTADYSYNIERNLYFGGYIGLGMNITKNVSTNIEFQHTNAAEAVALNLTWKF
jgi:hypothetical protein